MYTHDDIISTSRDVSVAQNKDNGGLWQQPIYKTQQQENPIGLFICSTGLLQSVTYFHQSFHRYFHHLPYYMDNVT
jgi:hypothetical protein